MKIIQEFKEFATRGNVIDLAVGVVIGGAFGKIVSSLVSDVIMPPIGLLLNGMDFKDIKIQMKAAVMQGDKIIKPAVTLNIGNFLQNCVDYLIIAFVIMIVIKAINKFHNKNEEPKVVEPTKEELLLIEIRDLLKESKT